MSPHSDHAPSTADPQRLAVRAGGRSLLLVFDAIEEIGVPAPVLPVPGASAWVRGLTVCRGRLRTLIDAGLVFGDRPAGSGGLVVLKGLDVETALAVDDHPRLVGEADVDPTALTLDRQALAAHPAFQPGAAGTEAR